MPLSQSEHYRDALECLAREGLSEQWAPSSLDWSLSIVMPAGVRPRAYVDMVSQLYHFEEASIEVLGRLLEETVDGVIRRYLHTQIADETRHAQTYKRYLEIMGDMAPINEGLRILLDMGLGVERSFRSKIIALHVMMEADALRQQRIHLDSLPCPLLGEINRLVAQDEARHAHFGMLYIKRALASAGEADKQAIVRFGASLWRLWESAQLERYGQGEAALFGTRPEDFRARWAAIRRRFTEVGLLPSADMLASAHPRAAKRLNAIPA